MQLVFAISFFALFKFYCTVPRRFEVTEPIRGVDHELFDHDKINHTRGIRVKVKRLSFGECPLPLPNWIFQDAIWEQTLGCS